MISLAHFMHQDMYTSMEIQEVGKKNPKKQQQQQ